MDSESLRKLKENRIKFRGLSNNIGGLLISKNNGQFYIGIEHIDGASYFPISSKLYEELTNFNVSFDDGNEIIDENY